MKNIQQSKSQNSKSKFEDETSRCWLEKNCTHIRFLEGVKVNRTLQQCAPISPLNIQALKWWVPWLYIVPIYRFRNIIVVQVSNIQVIYRRFGTRWPKFLPMCNLDVYWTQRTPRNASQKKRKYYWDMRSSSYFKFYISMISVWPSP